MPGIKQKRVSNQFQTYQRELVKALFCYFNNMKKPRDFFRDKPELLNESSVLDLIDYCQELEGELLEKKRVEKYNKEQILLQFIKELHDSCKTLEEQEEESKRFRETPSVNFQEAVSNLKTYIENFRKDNFL